MGEWAEWFHSFVAQRATAGLLLLYVHYWFYDTSSIIFLFCLCVAVPVSFPFHVFFQLLYLDYLLSVIKVSHGERHTATERRRHTYFITLSHMHTFPQSGMWWNFFLISSNGFWDACHFWNYFRCGLFCRLSWVGFCRVS